MRRVNSCLNCRGGSTANFSASQSSLPRASPLRLIVAGAPASGKGTQCEKTVADFGVVHISTGDILRAAVANKSSVGLAVQTHMDQGRLVPDELIITIVRNRLEQPDCKEKGWLLDGFPRTQQQAQALISAGLVPDAFILLDVPEDILVDRVVGRRMDPLTGLIYHLTFNPPPSDEIRSRLVQRADDTKEAIAKRFHDFQSHIGAVVGHFIDLLFIVDGSRPSHEVGEIVKAHIVNVASSLRGNAEEGSDSSPGGFPNAHTSTARRSSGSSGSSGIAAGANSTASRFSHFQFNTAVE